MKFSELDFKPHPKLSGIQAKHFFNNGYGVSILKSPHSYGGFEGLYELAILKEYIQRGYGSDIQKSWRIYENSPIADDFLGNLTEEQVESIVTYVVNL
mgnify:CR=1 FL=1